MENILFIDYATIVNQSNELVETSVFSLKDIVDNFNSLKIVCISSKDNVDDQLFNDVSSKLSQAFNVKKSQYFFKIDIDNANASNAIASWMSSRKVLSFAVVVQGCNSLELKQAFPNNCICCDAGNFSEAHAKDVSWILSGFKSSKQSNSNVFFVSDTHFGHANIIKYCNRPWNHGKDANGEIVATEEDVLAMDNEIVKRWNSVVKGNDIVWHLGDFALGGKEVAERVFPQLNGKINLVMGNHDHWKIKYYYDLGFHRVYDRKVIIDDFVILSHAPLLFLNANCPFYNVFGHIHNSPVYQTWSKTGCCVCVERHDYYPVPWKAIKDNYEKMNRK